MGSNMAHRVYTAHGLKELRLMFFAKNAENVFSPNEMVQGPCAHLGFKCSDMGIVAVTKRAVFTDDDGQHVIVKAQLKMVDSKKVIVSSVSASQELSNEWSGQYVPTIFNILGNFCIPLSVTEINISR
jgi:hypothetical protein